MQKLLKKNWISIIGFAFVTLIYLMAFRENMLTIMHDQLDGEILTYVLKANDPFAGNIKQLFNGTPASSMTPPALLFTLPYMIFSPAVAFHFNYFVIALTAYAGMFSCVNELTGKKWIALITSFLFTLLPFYSVYGLSVMGQPLIVCNFLKLWNWRKERSSNNFVRENLLSFILITCFGLSSSFILVGFADLFIIVVIGVYGLIKKHYMKPYLFGFFLLLGIYGITNWNLIMGVFGMSGDFITHKSEYIASSSGSFFEIAKTIFNEGQYHAASKHSKMITTSAITLLITLVFWKKYGKTDKSRVIQMGSLYALSLLIAGFYAFWHCAPIVELRNKIGGLMVEFQIDRFYWLYPLVWFLLFSYTLYFMWKLMEAGNWMKVIPIVIFTIINLSFLWNNSVLKINWEANNGGKSYSGYTTIDDFYQEKMFQDIDELIYSRTGKHKEDYRVISVGLYPSIALYNGYYCLDGYSNNYNVKYKHEFREIIGEELENNSNLKNYFDTWGNRVYAFVSEIPYVYYPNKNDGKTIENLKFNFDKLREMDCEFIFLAVQINNCEQLELIGNYETDTSFYELFVYELL